MLRRSRRFHLGDVPRIALLAIGYVAHLFSGRYWRVEGAHVLATDAEGRVLVVTTAYLGPEWMLPGGRVERGERPHAAAQREAREETGLEVRITRLLLVYSRTGRETSFIFAGDVVGGELEPQLGEIAEAGWMHPDEIARRSPRLHRLLELIDAAGPVAGYVSGGAP